MMNSTRKRKTSKAGRKTARTSTAQLLQRNAGSALRRGRETIGKAYGWAAHEAEGIRSLRLPSRSDIGHLSEANPLLLGAVGLGIGVAIGAFFPRSTRRMASGARRLASAPATPVRSRRSRRRKNSAAARKNATAATA